MRSQAFSVGMGNAPTDVTPPKPAPTPTESSAPSSTGSYSPMAAYYSPGAYGLSQVGNAIGDAVSKYATPAVKYVGDTFLGVDDFSRVPDKVRSGDWAGAAKSLGTGVAEAGTTAFGGSILRAGGKGLAFGAGKLGKYIPELETATETGGRLITGAKQRTAGLVGAAVIGLSPIAHAAGEIAPKAASSYSHLVGKAPAAVKGAVEGKMSAVKEGVKEAVPVVEGAVKETASKAGEFGAKAVNAAKAVFGDNADAAYQAPATVVRPAVQQNVGAPGEPVKEGPAKEPAKEPAKKPGKKVKPRNFDLDLEVGGQQAEMMVTR